MAEACYGVSLKKPNSFANLFSGASHNVEDVYVPEERRLFSKVQNNEEPRFLHSSE